MRRVLAVAGVCILSVSVGLLPAVLTSCAGTTAGRGPNPSGIYQFALEGLYLGSGTLSIDSTDGRCSGFADHPGSLGGIELVRCRLSDDGLSFTLRPATSSGLDIVVSAKIQGRTLGGRWSTRGRSGHFFAQSKSW